MTALNRLRVVAGLILLSAVYAVLVKRDPQIASAVSSGYVAILLTTILIINVWKKP